VNPKGKRLTTERGEMIGYWALIWAAGADPRPSSGKNVAKLPERPYTKSH